ncbi:crosslink repair DNA glycosylase YcaQ family protein [Mycoplasmatota bacterium WC30]
MRELHWTKAEAKDFMVKYHMINIKNQPAGTAGLKTVFDLLKSVQYDPLDVVGRNSDLVLQSRIRNYKKELLHKALYTERYLIDGWDKMMSIHRTKDFPYFSKIREYREQAALDTFTARNIRHAVDYSEEILAKIKENGPLYSREIELDNEEEARWKHGKLSSVTLDYLFNTGKIVVYNKTNAQKQFNLTETVFNFEDVSLSDDEFTIWYLKRRISSMGLVWNRGGVNWSGMYISNKNTRTKYLKKLLKTEEVTKIHVEGINYPLYALTESLDNASTIQNAISFIAPLDNLIWDRELTSRLFNFDYRWEVYTPVKKRKYGYYVLPIMYKSDFIGRIEFKHHRKNNPLEVKNIWLEEGIKMNKTLERVLKTALENFRKYLGASHIEGLEI